MSLNIRIEGNKKKLQIYLFQFANNNVCKAIDDKKALQTKRINQVC